jgi:hypothetical protein
MDAKRRSEPSRPISPTGRHVIHTRRRGFGDLGRRDAKPQNTLIWRFPEAAQLPGTSLLAGWLARAILALVTGYTDPGEHVLLLQVPLADRIGVRSSDLAPYRGLGEAAWPITRMGRGVVDIVAPTNTVGAEAALEGNLDWSSWAAEVGPDNFDLIVTATTPGDTSWLDSMPWSSLLATRGVVAVVSRSGNTLGRFVSPVTPIVQSLCRDGRGWLDHIAVVDKPAEQMPFNENTIKADGATPFTFMSIVHHDLLIFTRLPAVQRCGKRSFSGCIKTVVEPEAADD